MARVLTALSAWCAILGSVSAQEDSYVNESGYHCGNGEFATHGSWDADASVTGYLGTAQTSVSSSITVMGKHVPAWGASAQVKDSYSYSDPNHGYFTVWMGPDGATFPKHYHTAAVTGSGRFRKSYSGTLIEVGIPLPIKAFPAKYKVKVYGSVDSYANMTVTPDKISMGTGTEGSATGSVSLTIGFSFKGVSAGISSDLRFGRVSSYGTLTILGGKGYGGYGRPVGSYTVELSDVRLNVRGYVKMKNGFKLETNWVEDSLPDWDGLIWHGK